MAGGSNRQKKADKSKRHRKNGMRKSNEGKIFFHLNTKTNPGLAGKFQLHSHQNCRLRHQ